MTTHKTVESLNTALISVQKFESKVHEGALGASVLARIQRFERGGEFLLREGVYLILGKVSGGAERASAAASVESLVSTVVGEEFGKESLASFLSCVIERLCVGRESVFDGDVQVMCMNFGFISGKFCPSLDDCDGALKAFSVWWTEGWALREKRVYAGQEFRVQKNLSSSAVLF